MDSLVAVEQYIPALVPEIAIHNAAEARGIELEPNRLAQLTGLAERVQRLDGYSDRPSKVFQDLHNDVDVGYATFSERFGATAAQVDFTPILGKRGNVISGVADAHPEHAARFGLMLVHGMQNYALLVDAGIIERPDILFGNTNPEMAIVAERFGMLSDAARRHPNQPAVAHKEMRTLSKMEVHGSFDEVSGHAFSEDTKRFEQILARRLAAQKPVGQTALSS